MREKQYLRFVLPALLACAFIVIGLYKFSTLKGQIIPGAPVLLSPVGEALQIDPLKQPANSIPTIRVSWTLGSMVGRDYEITFRAVEKGRNTWYSHTQKIFVPYSSLPDKKNPSYDLPLSNLESTMNLRNLIWKLEPFVEYEITVTYAGTTPSPSSSSTRFWFAIKNTSYNSSVLTKTPTDKVTSDKALATWHKLPDRTRKYIIELSQGNSTETYTVDTRSLANVYEPSLDFTTKKPLERNVQYKFRVMGEDVYGQKTGWSAYRTFTVYDDPFSETVPVLISPRGSDEVFNINRIFRWQAVEGAKYYRIEVRGVNNQDSFTHTVLLNPDGTITVSGLDNTNGSFSYSGEKVDYFDKSMPSLFIRHIDHDRKVAKTYKWYVYAYSVNDTISKSSGENSFTLAVPTMYNKKPEAVGPNGTVFKDFLNYSWKKVPGAVRYEVMVYAAGQAPIIGYVKNTDMIDQDVLSTSFSSISLSYDKEYSFTVTAFNLNDEPSQPSEPMRFRTTKVEEFPGTELVAPKITGPLNGASQFSLVAWNAVPGATSYIVSIKDYTTGRDVPAVNYTVTAKQLTNPSDPKYGERNWFQPQGLYGIWIRAVREVPNTKTLHSAWSKRLIFVPAIGYPGTNIRDTLPSVKPTITGPLSPTVASPVMSWNQVPGASTYQVYIQNNSTKAIEKVLVVEGGMMKSYKPDYSYTAGGRYTFWVRAIGGGEMSAWSDPWVFTIHP